MLISAFSFFSLFVLGIRVLQDRGGKSSLLFGLYALAAAFVSLLELMIRLSETAARARVWAGAAFLWPLAPALFLHFVLVATIRPGRLRSFLVVIDYGGAVVMSVVYAFYVQTGNALEWRQGWALTSPGAADWPWLISTILASIYVVFSLSLFLFRTFRAGGELAPRELRWLFFAYVVRLVFAMTVHVVALQFGMILPEMNSLSYAVFAILIYIGISRAYLLSLTPRRTVGAIISTMEELLFLTTRDNTIVTANPAAGAFFNVDSQQLRGKSLPDLVGLENEEPLPTETEVRDRGGESRTLQLLRSDVTSPAGEPIGLVYLGRDVTKDRQREAALSHTLAEKDAVLHELHHRVHNTLQTVTSLLRLKAVSTDVPETEQTLTESAEIVQRIGQVHRWAYDTGDMERLRFDEILKQVCEDIYQENRGNGELQFRIRTEAMDLRVQSAIPLLLLTNELLLNVFSKAHERSEKGVVEVAVTPGAADTWVLTITNPADTAPGCVGVEPGPSEIATALAEQAGASIMRNRSGTSIVTTVSPV